jgi:hypothetical protein
VTHRRSRYFLLRRAQPRQRIEARIEASLRQASAQSSERLLSRSFKYSSPLASWSEELDLDNRTGLGSTFQVRLVLCQFTISPAIFSLGGLPYRAFITKRRTRGAVLAALASAARQSFCRRHCTSSVAPAIAAVSPSPRSFRLRMHVHSCKLRQFWVALRWSLETLRTAELAAPTLTSPSGTHTRISDVRGV